MPLSPPHDPILRRHILECIASLSAKLNAALTARLEHWHRHDDAVARLLKMTKNTFLQNIVRARRQVDACLKKKGIHEHEVLR